MRNARTLPLVALLIVACGDAPHEVDRAETQTTDGTDAISVLRGRQRLTFYVDGIAEPVSIPLVGFDWPDGQTIDIADIYFGGSVAPGAPESPDLLPYPSGISYGPDQRILDLARSECDHRYWLASESTVPWNGAARPECVLFNTGWTPGSITIEGTGCVEFNCAVQEHLCVANLLLEIAAGTYETSFHVMDRTQYGGPATPGVITIPVQALATRAGLYEVAGSYMTGIAGGSLGIANLFGALTGPNTDDCDDISSTTPDVTNAAELVVNALEFYETSMEAGEGAVELYSALADAEYANADPANGIESASAIRQFAANVVTGGFPFNPAASSLCNATTLDEDGRAALGYLRNSAISPVEIAREQSIQTLLGDPSDDGTTNALHVFPRLVNAWGRADEGLTASSLLREIGLSNEDFEAARAYLRQEFTAFERSATAILPDSTIPNVLPNGNKYAATAFPPSEPLGILHVARARDAIDERYINYGGITYGGMSTGTSVLALFNDLLLRAARLSTTPSVKTTLEDAAERVSSVLYGDLRGKVYVYRPIAAEADDDYEGVIFAEGYSASELFVTTDPQDVVCAVAGSVDGVRCDLDAGALSAVTLDTELGTGIYSSVEALSRASGIPFEDAITSGLGFPMVEAARSGAVDAYTFEIPWEAASGPVATVYVLRKRPGSGTAARPSTFDALGAVTWYPVIPYQYASLNGTATPDGGVVEDRGWVISANLNPRLDALVSDLITPATSDCSRARVSCAGVSHDARLPLEDSLNSDGDAYESSWRYYLNNARNYADIADRLGEQALNESLEIDRLAEGALAEVADVCGFTPSLDPLAATLAGRSGDPVTLLAELPNTNNDNQRIVDCLGAASTVPYVSLGSVPLCVFHPNDRPDELCVDASNSHGGVCPRIIAEGTSAPCPATNTNHPGHTYVEIGGNSLLRYFGEPEGETGAGTSNTTEGTCNQYRRIREALEDPMAPVPTEDYQELFVDSGLFDSATVNRVAKDITWRAEPGGYSVLSVSNQPLISTGSLTRGPSYGGTCGSGEGLIGTTMNEPCDVEYPNSLFCKARFCGVNAAGGSREPIDELNARMARAATVARWLGQHNLERFVFPMVDYSFPSGRDPLSASLRTPGGRIVGHFTDGSPEDHYYCEPVINANPLIIWQWSHSLRSVGGSFVSPANNQMFCNEVPDPNSEWPSTYRRAIRFREVDADHAYGFKDNPGRNIVDANSLRAADLLSRLTPNAFRAGFPGPLNSETGGGLFRRLHRGDSHISTRCSGCTNDVNNQDLTFWYAGDSATDIDKHMAHAAATYYFDSADELPRQAFLDALELICMGTQGTTAFGDIDVGAVSTKDDLKVALAGLRTAAEEIGAMGNTMVMSGMPQNVVDALTQQSALVTPTPGAGTTAVQIARIRGAMIQLRAVPDDIEDALKVVVVHGEIATNAFDRAEAEEQRAWLGFQSTAADRLTSCLTAQASSASVAGVFGGKFAGAVVTCANSVVQIALAASQLMATNEIIDLDRKDALNRFMLSALDTASQLEALRTSLLVQTSEIDSALTQLENDRMRGRRALARALFLDSSDTHEVYRSNTTLRRRLNTSQIRYERARTNAIRWSFMAKRAIEQRFGINLSDLRTSMGALPAPSTWESSLCTMHGIDYERIRNTTTSSGEPTPNNFAEGYVGDYVTNLENFVDAYRTAYPFFEGRDTAVVSLRDDVQNVRDFCDVPMPNLLAYSTDLDRNASPVLRGWSSDGCELDTDGTPLRSCVRVMPLTDAADSVEQVSPSAPSRAQLGFPEPHTITFGPTDVACDTDGPCGWQPGATWGQTTDVEPGHYVVSWYARSVSPAVAIDRAVRVVQLIGGSAAATWAPNAMNVTSAATGHNGWSRYWFGFDVPSRSTVRVEVGAQVYVGGVPGGAVVPATDEGTEFDVAGLMLERAGAGIVVPSTFVATGEENTRSLQLCEDTDGDVYRRSSWGYQCVRLCNDGFGTLCAEEQSTEYCYWETEFDVSNRALERGDIFRSSSFARGNFNYRLDTIGVNFVGTASRTCADSDLPSTCYSAGFIPYSLEHVGPFPVRNHFGEIYDAPLFTGLIEHARGLASERYITNPISSADSALLSQYTQETFRGRPVTGTYRLRVWDEPGVNFQGIEDVQVVLGYTYWTRSP